MTQAKGIFLALEGIDGSGKTTQLQKLAARLAQLNIKHYSTQEPTGGPVGSLIRQILTGRTLADNRVMASLFVADRLDHLLNNVDGISQKIDAGVCVLTDRYYFSSYAYQSVDMDLNWLINANRPIAEILRPNLTIFLDIPVSTALARIQAGRFHTELYEKEERLLAVRKQYLTAFAQLQAEENIAIIDADADADTVAERIWQATAPLFG